MQARIKQPALSLPGAFDSLQAVEKSIAKAEVPRATLELMNVRASQINGCSLCVDMHSRALLKLGQKAERIFSVAAWREAPYFTDAERAALALTEAATRLSDRADPVPEDVWAAAASHYSEIQLAALVLSIGLINLWNRLNAATHQAGGDFLERYI